MIYRISISTGRAGQDVDIYAHPAWEKPIDNHGDPTDEFKVIFVISGSDRTVAVYKRAVPIARGPYSMPPSKLLDVYQQLLEAPSEGSVPPLSITRITAIEDLSIIG